MTTKHTLRHAFLTSPFGPEWRAVWIARLVVSAVYVGLGLLILAVLLFLRYAS